MCVGCVKILRYLAQGTRLSCGFGHSQTSWTQSPGDTQGTTARAAARGILSVQPILTSYWLGKSLTPQVWENDGWLVAGSQTAPRLSQRPWGKDKGNISSMSFARESPDWDWNQGLEGVMVLSSGNPASPFGGLWLSVLRQLCLR